jgi:hypothetical protein
MGDSGRRYSDEDFALILERASKLQDRAEGAATELPGRPGRGPSADGLSLQAVRDIAEEVGVEARYIDQAAESLLLDPPGRRSGLLGGPLTHHVGDTYARALTQSQRAELVDVIRQTLRHPGEVRDVMGSIEWRSVGQLGRTKVTIHAHKESVSIRVFADLSGLAAGIWGASMLASMILGSVVVDIVHPTFLGALPILGAAAVVGAGVARTLWSATTNFFRRRTDRLREELAAYLGD